MNLLLDTQTLLWAMEANLNLSSTAAALVADPANRLHLSMASIWEIGIKVGSNREKLLLRQDFDHWTKTGLAQPPDLQFLRGLFSSRSEPVRVHPTIHESVNGGKTI